MRNLRNEFTQIVNHVSSRLVDTTNYDQTYKDMFSKYFEKGDGDGN